MLINFPHQHFITCTTVKIHSFNVPLHGLLCQFQLLEFTPLCYEQHKRFNIHGTVHQHFQCFDISRGIGDRVNNGERPGISTARLFLPYDQIMTFDWMWTVMWLFKRETVCGGWDHKMCHVIRWGALHSLITFSCSFVFHSFGAWILL